jgi:DMSO/TMAO reductase YedYZ molybdopterin-dependent catalytic subunit
MADNERPLDDLEREVITEHPPNMETPLPALLEELTPRGLFYVRSNFPVPEIDRDSHRLRVAGAVASPLELSLDDLAALARDVGKGQETVTLECAGNARKSMEPVPSGTAWGWGAASTGQFAGVPLAAVLEKAGLSSDVVEIAFAGADHGEIPGDRHIHFERSMPLDEALRSEVLLAWTLNGEDLPAENGYPLRLVVPGWYGVASVKWLSRIEALTEPFEGHFQTEKYVYVGEDGTPDGTPVRRMRVRSLIASPEHGARVAVGRPLKIEGVAWSGEAEVTGVEVSTDGGTTWRTAHLGGRRDCALGPGVACSWWLPWAPEEVGTRRLLVRARDARGREQSTEPRWNQHGYGNDLVHGVDVAVV